MKASTSLLIVAVTPLVAALANGEVHDALRPASLCADPSMPTRPSPSGALGRAPFRLFSTHFIAEGLLPLRRPQIPTPLRVAGVAEDRKAAS